MRVLINYMLRVDRWYVHAVTEDCGTGISRMITVHSEETLLRLLRYLGATEEELECVLYKLNQWSRGGVFLNLTSGRRNLLGIRSPWSDGLTPAEFGGRQTKVGS